MSSTRYHAIRYVRLLTDRHHAETTNDTWLNASPDFQREYDQRPHVWIANLLDSILKGRAMPPIWTVYNENDNSDEVLDGQHRLLTILKFINNEIRIQDRSREHLHNKYFSELTKTDQQTILNFSISFNKLDGSYHTPEKLFEMYEILNRSSRPLNKYEVFKPLRLEFYRLLQSKLIHVQGHPLFQEKENKRGTHEMRVIQMLALHDLDHSNRYRFNSMEDVKDQWCQKYIGDTDQTIRENFCKHQIRINDMIDQLIRSMNRFRDLSLFHNENNQSIVDKHTQLIFQMIIALTVKICGNDKRPYPQIVNMCKEKIFSNISLYCETDGRDQKFQKIGLKKVFNDITTIYKTFETKRLFSKSMIDHKLDEQNKECKRCNKPIENFQSYEGDHIIPFQEGGKTEYDNLRVVHSICHRI